MVHDGQEARVEITQDRSGHGPGHARVQVAWAWPEQHPRHVRQFTGESIVCGRHYGVLLKKYLGQEKECREGCLTRQSGIVVPRNRALETVDLGVVLRAS